MKKKPTVASIIRKAAEDWGVLDTYHRYSQNFDKERLARTLRTKGVMATRLSARLTIRYAYPRYFGHCAI